MNIDEILTRMKEFLHLKRDADLARALNVKPQNIINWRKRKSIPWPEIQQLSSEHEISLNWLINGEGVASANKKGKPRQRQPRKNPRGF